MFDDMINNVVNTTSLSMVNVVNDVSIGNFIWGPGSGFFGGFGYFGIVWLVFLILGILLCVWIYRDANRRGMSGILWVILMLVGSLFFLGWLVVLIVYLIIRK